MNYYETLYIVHSALEAGRLKDIVLTVEDLLKENGGEIITTEIWGKKKLGYFIDKQKYGTYILIQFKSDGIKNNNFNVEMEHNPSILAYMTIRIEEDAIHEQIDDLDTQIAGKETKTSQSERVEKTSKRTSTEETITQLEQTPVEDIVVEDTTVEIEENEKEATTEKTPTEKTVTEETPVEIENSKEETAPEDVPAEAEITEKKVEE